MAPGAVILVAVDMTENGTRVLDRGLEMARAFDAELLLVHVVHRLDSLYGLYVGGGSVAEIQHELEESARDKLAALRPRADDAPDCREMVLTGQPWSEIVGCARHHGARCIVIGAHVDRKPEHRMLGSTAQRVVRHAPCPVLVVPPGEVEQ